MNNIAPVTLVMNVQSTIQIPQAGARGVKIVNESGFLLTATAEGTTVSIQIPSGGYDFLPFVDAGNNPLPGFSGNVALLPTDYIANSNLYPAMVALLTVYGLNDPFSQNAFPGSFNRLQNQATQVALQVLQQGEAPGNDLVKSSPIGMNANLPYSTQTVTVELSDTGLFTLRGWLDNGEPIVLFQIKPYGANNNSCTWQVGGQDSSVPAASVGTMYSTTRIGDGTSGTGYGASGPGTLEITNYSSIKRDSGSTISYNGSPCGMYIPITPQILHTNVYTGLGANTVEIVHLAGAAGTGIPTGAVAAEVLIEYIGHNPGQGITCYVPGDAINTDWDIVTQVSGISNNRRQKVNLAMSGVNQGAFEFYVNGGDSNASVYVSVHGYYI